MNDESERTANSWPKMRPMDEAPEGEPILVLHPAADHMIAVIRGGVVFCDTADIRNKVAKFAGWWPLPTE